MAVTILYTNSDKVRALLGIGTDDYSDTQFTARGLETDLRADLYEWLPKYESIFDASDASSTDKGLQPSRLLTMYSAVFCGVALLDGAPNFAPQAVSDGKNSFKRVDHWSEVKESLLLRLTGLKQRILDATSTTSAASSYTAFSGDSPSYDPVTGR